MTIVVYIAQTIFKQFGGKEMTIFLWKFYRGKRKGSADNDISLRQKRRISQI